MKMNAVEHLFTLQHSPILLAPYLHQFYTHLPQRERNLLLSYLVLPMILYPPMQAYLLQARKTSNLRTMCAEQSRLVGLTYQVNQFKSQTNSAILILQAAECIEITHELSVKTISTVNSNNANPLYLNAAQRLAILLSEDEIPFIYRTLGFKTL